jgi:hypothetical protein
MTAMDHFAVSSADVETLNGQGSRLRCARASRRRGSSPTSFEGIALRLAGGPVSKTPHQGLHM